MKALHHIAAIAACAIFMSSCSGKAATPQTVENDMETVDSGITVRQWNEGEIAPDPTMPIVIDFNATWCPPCRMFGPVFEEIAKENNNRAIFMSVDVDKNQAAARQFGITSIPQVSIVFPDSRVVTTTGYMDQDQFRDFLHKSGL